MKFPNRIIKIGEKDTAIVIAIAGALASRGIAVTSLPGVFDSALASAVKLFQSLNRDIHGHVLAIDGEVGPMTWGALFGAASLMTAGTAASPLALEALRVAQGEIGKMEIPIGSNRGPDVEKYLKSTGLPGGHFWCMAFVFWCFKTAAGNLGVANPFPKTAGVLDAWNKSQGMRITKAAAVANLSRVGPGAVFIMDFGNGSGHTGFVESNSAGDLTTVEGNTDPGGSNNGIGVFRLNRRKVSTNLMKGFILVP
jgi:hypothetical protein